MSKISSVNRFSFLPLWAVQSAAEPADRAGSILSFAVLFTTVLGLWWWKREAYIERLIGFTKKRSGAVRIFRFNFIASIILVAALWWAVLTG